MRAIELAGGAADLDLVPALDALEGDRAEAVGQLDRVALAQVETERLAVLLHHLLGVGLVEHVDRLPRAVVEPEVAGVDRQRQQRVDQVAEARPRHAVAERERRVELALQPDLARQRVGRLHDAEGLEGLVGRQEDRRPAVGHVAVAVPDRDERRVAVPDQEHLGAADGQRVVDLELVALDLRVRRLLVVQRADELARHPGPRPLGQPVDLEVLDRERERLEVLGREQAARHEVVVLRQVVGEALPLDHDHAALVAEQPADGEADQHHEHREVEDEVARLAQVALLGRDVSPSPTHDPVATALQLGRGPLEHVARVHRPSCTPRARAASTRFRGARGGLARRARQ